MGITKAAFKFRLRRAGLNLTEFAAEVGLSRSAVQRWGSPSAGAPAVPLWAMQYLVQRADLNAYEDLFGTPWRMKMQKFTLTKEA